MTTKLTPSLLHGKNNNLNIEAMNDLASFITFIVLQIIQVSLLVFTVVLFVTGFF